MVVTVEKQRLSAEDIAVKVRSAILTGEMTAGMRLGEAELAERFGVSRGPVRDALRMLTGVGLVSFTPNVGARVREFSIAEARALYQLREALEGQVAALAAENAVASDVDRLQALLVEHAAIIDRHPDSAYLQSDKDRDFHLVLAELADNPLIYDLLARELYPQLVLLRQSHRLVRGRGAKALTEHERIVEAVADHDSELAALLMRRHIRSSWTSFDREQNIAGK